MADATGSSAGAGVGAAAAAGHVDLGKGIAQGQYQAFLTSSMPKIAPNYVPQQAHPHQYPTAPIPAPMGMPMPASRPLYNSQIAVPPQQLAPLPQYHIQSQPPPLAERYRPQDYSIGNTTSWTSPLGFAEWRMNNNALMSFPQTTFGSSSMNNCNFNFNNNGFRPNSSPYSTNMWTNYMPRNLPYYTNYGPATNEPVPQVLSFQNSCNNKKQEKDLGIATSFGATAPAVSVSPFELMSQMPINCSSPQIFQEVKNTDYGTTRAFGSGEIERSDTSEESDIAPELEAQNQLGQGDGDTNSMDFILNCEDYHTVLCKDLTNSDCGSTGRIVLPKRDAEVNLPALVDKDAIILEMDDFELSDVWKFKYRYWPNNKSRMYILETTGEFVKRHGLEAGDILVIYNHKRTGRYVARGVKASQLSSTTNMMECQCTKAGNSAEECGFAIPTKKKT